MTTRARPTSRGDRRRGRDAAELRLARYARTRDPGERAWLVNRYMPLARRLAAPYRNDREPREDLLQVATIGLIAAIERFDPSRGTAFTSFAVPTIRGELRRHLRDHSWSVHVPRGMRELADRLPAGADELSARLGRPPTRAELAVELERPVEHIDEAYVALSGRNATSLDEPVGDNGEPLGDVLDGGDRGLADAQDRIVVDQLIAGLPKRQQTILSLRIHTDLTLSEIGELLSLSQSHVGRLLRQSLAVLRAQAQPPTNP
jgi:RNA polymerase sigma-B factor